MSGVRVLVGTRKGAFTLTSDGQRKQWDVNGPFFGGWEIYHLKGSSADPNGGRTWEPVGNKFAYDGPTGTHLWYDGTPHPWEFKRVWHIEPSPTDPDTIYAGVEDAALFKSIDEPACRVRPACGASAARRLSVLQPVPADGDRARATGHARRAREQPYGRGSHVGLRSAFSLQPGL